MWPATPKSPISPDLDIRTAVAMPEVRLRRPRCYAENTLSQWPRTATLLMVNWTWWKVHVTNTRNGKWCLLPRFLAIFDGEIFGEIDISPNRATVFDYSSSHLLLMAFLRSDDSWASGFLAISVYAAYPLRYFRSVFTVYLHTSGRSKKKWDVTGLISGDSGDASSDCRPIKGLSVFCGGQFTDMMQNMQNNMFFCMSASMWQHHRIQPCRISQDDPAKVAPLCSHWPSWFANTPNWQGEP